MRKEMTIRFIVILTVVLAGFLILRSSSLKKQTPCKESMEECCHKKTTVPADNHLILETFSRQFISIVQ